MKNSTHSLLLQLSAFFLGVSITVLIAANHAPTPDHQIPFACLAVVCLFELFYFRQRQ